MKSLSVMDGKKATRFRHKLEWRLSDEANDQIIEASQQALALGLANSAGVFMKGDIAYIMQAVLNLPMVTDQLHQTLRGTAIGCQTGDAKNHFVGEFASFLSLNHPL